MNTGTNIIEDEGPFQISVADLRPRINIEMLAEGKWTESGDIVGATQEELAIIAHAREILKRKEKNGGV